MELTQKELSIIAGALNAQLNRGPLTTEEAGDISELADRIVANQEGDEDDINPYRLTGDELERTTARRKQY